MVVGFIRIMYTLGSIRLISNWLSTENEQLTDIYWITSELATIDADIRLAGSTEYSARAFRIALV